MRILWRFTKALHVCPCARYKVPEADLWSTPGPDRHPYRSAARRLRKLSGDRVGESSESIRARVQAARDIQTKRYLSIRTSNTELSNIVCNANMRIGEIRQFCRLPEEGQRLIRAAMTQFNLSARVYHRILKLARTIADLAGREEIQSVHLAEALQSRPKQMRGNQ